MSTEITSNIKLTKDQEEVYNEVMLSIKKHKQAAIHLVTSGGKTFILLSVINALKERSKSKKIKAIYISTPISCTNFMSNTTDEYWDDIFTFVTYNRLATNENYIDSIGIQKPNVIILDEAHHALAPKTYKGVQYILNKFPSAIVIAMSANNKRDVDNKMVFNWLTPKLVSGKDYTDRGLKYAIDNDKICNFHYKNYNIALLQNYYDIFQSFNRMHNLDIDTDNIFYKAKEIIESFKNNAFDKLTLQLSKDIREVGIDGKQGDRWFVFFNYVDELKESIDNIRELFEKAYDNKNLTINIHEYHNSSSNVAETHEVLTGRATPNTVDIIMTCLKGGESFHPENTRGIIMYRKSNSEINITQMLGRTLQIKEMCNDTKLVYDLVGNCDRSKTCRVASDIQLLSNMKYLYLNRDSTVSKLKDTYGEVGEYSEIIDDELEDLLGQAEEYKNKIEKILYAKIIKEVLDANDKVCQNNNTMIMHPLFVLQEYDKKHYKYKLADEFVNIQKLFIQGYFGEYTMDTPNNSIFFIIYNMLGDKLYMTRNCIGEANWGVDSEGNEIKVKLADLQNIASEVKRYNYNYNTSISHTKDLNNKISRLRILNLEGKLSESYQKYCKRNKIDIDGLYTNLISTVTQLCKENKKDQLLKEFKSIVRELNFVESLISRNMLNDSEIDSCRRALANQQIFSEFYGRNEYGKQAVVAIKIRYKDTIAFCKKDINKNDYTNALKDIRAIRIFKSYKDKSDALISGEHETAIMELAKRNENNNIGEYEAIVLDILGVREFKGKRDKSIQNLVDKTVFGVNYNKFINDGSLEAYNKIKLYDLESIPSYCKNLLNKRKFKKNINEIHRNEILLRDNNDIKRVVAELTYPDDELIKSLKTMINPKEFDTRNLIKYAIPDTIYSINKKILDLAISEDWDNIDKISQTKIIKVLSNENSLFCIGSIAYNLKNANLIPEEQITFVNKIIELAEF